MGCSASKGQLFSRKSASEEIKRKDEPPVAGEIPQTTSEEVKAPEEPDFHEKTLDPDSVFEVKDEPLKILNEEAAGKIPDELHPPIAETVALQLENNLTDQPQAIQAEDEQGRRRKTRKQRIRRSSNTQCKADFILKARHAVHEFLNTNSSKFESILGLQRQAVQLRLSVEGAVSSALLLYEEIIQALEETANEGELLLIQNGPYLNWPGTLKDQTHTENSTTDIRSAIFQSGEILPELDRFPSGATLQALSLSGLQELSLCLGNLSEIAEQKLLSQLQAERRLRLVLSQVEAAALGKDLPDDSALHSEDSGIGGENESRNGAYPRIPPRTGPKPVPASVFPVSFSPDQQIHNDDDEEDEDYDDEKTEIEKEETCKEEQRNLPDERMPLLPGASEAKLDLPYVNSLVKRRRIRRPKTAENSLQGNRQSLSCQKTTRSHSLDNQMCRDRDYDQGDKSCQQSLIWNKKTSTQDDIGVESRRRNAQSADRYYGLQYGSKGPFKALPPSSSPTLIPEPPGRNAVKRLINTFSRGVEQHPTQEQRPFRVRAIRNCTLPLIHNSRGTLTTNIDTSGHTHYQIKADVDLDSLPPPPPEMLMDNSFEGSFGLEDADINSQNRVNRHCNAMYSETQLPNPKTLPPTTPPVSRTRMPPSCAPMHYTVPHPPSTSSSAWTPGGRWTPSVKPCSGSQSYLEARAVFSRGDSSWTPSCASTLPRPWGKTTQTSNISTTTKTTTLPIFSDDRMSTVSCFTECTEQITLEAN